MIPQPQFPLRLYRSDPLACFRGLQESQGDLAVSYLGRQRILYFSSAELIEEAFSRHSKSIAKKNRVRRWWLSSPEMEHFGPMVETHDRDAHRQARKHMHPAFAKERARGDVPKMREVIEDLIAEKGEQGVPVDMYKFSAALVTAGFIASALRQRLSLQEAERWAELRSHTSAYASRPVFNSRYSSLYDGVRRLFPLSVLRRAINSQEELENVCRAYMTDPAPNTLPHMLRAAGVGDDPGQLLSLLISALETATPLTEGWMSIGSDSALQSALAAEARAYAHEPEKSSELPLIHGAAVEAVRIAAILTIGRVCQTPFLVGDFEVRQNDFLFACPHLLHRDQRYWPDPERLLPERWTEEAERERPRFSFFAFGGPGPRACAGRHQAIELMGVILSGVLRDWEVELLTPIESVGWKVRLALDDLVPDRPIIARLHRRA